jgi:glyoxylase-like metal-dependent hydrolase (beta-lactamase superfamily II)
MQEQVLWYQIQNVKIFLIQSNQGFVLVDAGIPGLEREIDAAFQEWNVEPRAVTDIILTHGHLDHIGCLGYARKITRAKVICHRSIAYLLAAGKYEEAVPRVWYWKILNTPISKIMGARLSPVSPDIVFDKEYDLAEIGLAGKILHTPGHSPGSCSILLDSGEALIGDLVRENRAEEIDTGLFYDDWDDILHSIDDLLKQNPQKIYFSHGKVSSFDRLRTFQDSI